MKNVKRQIWGSIETSFSASLLAKLKSKDGII